VNNKQGTMSRCKNKVLLYIGPYSEARIIFVGGGLSLWAPHGAHTPSLSIQPAFRNSEMAGNARRRNPGDGIQTTPYAGAVVISSWRNDDLVFHRDRCHFAQVK
jgi:hypothetical protein